jgi:hypothetical protein
VKFPFLRLGAVDACGDWNLVKFPFLRLGAVDA